MKHLEGLIPLRPFQSLSGKGRSDSAAGGRGKNRAADDKTKVEFLLKQKGYKC